MYVYNHKNAIGKQFTYITKSLKLYSNVAYLNNKAPTFSGIGTVHQIERYDLFPGQQTFSRQGMVSVLEIKLSEPC